jgi:hypothetical protein
VSQLREPGCTPASDRRVVSARERRSHIVIILWTKCQAWVLRMSEKAVVQIIGAPIACSEGYKDAWRETAQWAASQLASRFGEAVSVEYFDLFDAACPSLPANAQLPLVLINDEVIINGGKISIPLIRKRLVELGVGQPAV